MTRETQLHLRDSFHALRKYKKEKEKLIDAPWIVEDEALEGAAMSFADSFAVTLPERYDYATDPFCFSRYIEDTLEYEDHKKLVAIEFGGPGGRLFAGFTPGFFSRTIGVCLRDNREPSDKKWDVERGHTVLEIDMLQTGTYQTLEKLLVDKSVGLIISRTEGAIGWLPDDPIILGNLASRWYKILMENGLLFVQYNPSAPSRAYDQEKRTAMVDEWIRLLKYQYADTLDVEGGTSAFRLHKKRGAPRDLPLVQ